MKPIFKRFIRPNTPTAAWSFVAIMAVPTVALAQTAEVRQLSYWGFDEASGTEYPEQLDSRVFQIELSFDPDDPAVEQLLDANSGAYVNILFRPDAFMPWEWAVQNVFVSVPDSTWLEPGNIAYEFSSELWFNGLLLSECDLGITLTEEPVPDEPIIVPGEERHVPVDPRERMPSVREVEEDLGPIELEPPLNWEHIFHEFGYARRGDDRARTIIPPAWIPTIDVGRVQCAAGAHARSLAYLSLLWDFPLENLAPDGTPLAEGPQDLMGSYAEQRETTEDMSALERIARRHLDKEYRTAVHQAWDLPIRSGESERRWFAPSEFKVLMRDASNRLRHGHDVELDYVFTKSDGTNGKHRVMLTEITTIHGVDGTTMYFITALDDDVQGDGLAGIRVRTYLVDEDGWQSKRDADGNYHRTGRVHQLYWDEYIPRLRDLNDDGEVNGGDLGQLLGKFGLPSDGSEDDGDFNGDGIVDGADLGQSIGAWGKTFDF